MMSQKNRESGWYWVRFNGEWEIGNWNSSRKFWCLLGRGYRLFDGDMDFIDERRITREEPKS